MEEMYTQLVEECRRRDRRAMRRLYETTAPMAMGVCMRYCRNREEAQDVMQDGYVKVFERIGRLREPEKLMAWVYQLMVNECLNHLRDRMETVSLDEVKSLRHRRWTPLPKRRWWRPCRNCRRDTVRYSTCWRSKG